MNDGNNPLQNAVDGATAAVTIASVLNYLPAVAAVLSIIWLAIRIYESKTVQKLLHKGRKHWTDYDTGTRYGDDD